MPLIEDVGGVTISSTVGSAWRTASGWLVTPVSPVPEKASL